MQINNSWKEITVKAGSIMQIKSGTLLIARNSIPTEDLDALLLKSGEKINIAEDTKLYVKSTALSLTGGDNKIPNCLIAII